MRSLKGALSSLALALYLTVASPLATAADVTVFDPKARWKVDASQFVSKGRNSPYDGMTLVGRATCTIVAGSVVYRSGNPVRGREKSVRTRG